MNWDEEDTTIYQVVINHEEQYSIWPEYKDIPNGWKAVGPKGLKNRYAWTISTKSGRICGR